MNTENTQVSKTNKNPCPYGVYTSLGGVDRNKHNKISKLYNILYSIYWGGYYAKKIEHYKEKWNARGGEDSCN